MRRVAGMVVVVLALVAGLVGAGPAGAQSGEVGGDVVGGQPADPGEHPFQVAVVYDPALVGGDPLLNQFCAGALVAPDVVLTAAHCAEEAIYAAQEGFPYVGVVAGIADLDEAEPSDVIAIEGECYRAREADAQATARRSRKKPPPEPQPDVPSDSD